MPGDVLEVRRSPCILFVARATEEMVETDIMNRGGKGWKDAMWPLTRVRTDAQHGHDGVQRIARNECDVPAPDCRVTGFGNASNEAILM